MAAAPMVKGVGFSWKAMDCTGKKRGERPFHFCVALLLLLNQAFPSPSTHQVEVGRPLVQKSVTADRGRYGETSCEQERVSLWAKMGGAEELEPSK